MFVVWAQKREKEKGEKTKQNKRGAFNMGRAESDGMNPAGSYNAAYEAAAGILSPRLSPLKQDKVERAAGPSGIEIRQ